MLIQLICCNKIKKTKQKKKNQRTGATTAQRSGTPEPAGHFSFKRINNLKPSKPSQQPTQPNQSLKNTKVSKKENVAKSNQAYKKFKNATQVQTKLKCENCKKYTNGKYKKQKT